MFLHSISLVWLVFAIIFLWRRIREAFQVKSSEKYRQNLVVYELYISIGLKKSYRLSSIFYPHTVAHLCNQFNHVFAVLISMPRFKSNKFCKTRSKIKLLLQKNCKIFECWGPCPQTPNGFRRLEVAPIPKNTTLSLQFFGFAPG